MIIYFDMDGVLCNFEKRCSEFNAWREDIHKCNWDLLDKIGPKFWAEMESIPQGMELLSLVESFAKINKDIQVGIFSAVHLLKGKIGKKQWIKSNTNISPDLVKLINNGNQKYKQASPDSILIDDKPENVSKYIEAGGHAVLFDPNKPVDELFYEIVSLC